jgi:hypothetical protein
MKIHDVEQGSVSWGKLRAGIPTASEFHNLVTPKFKIRTGEMVETYLASKLAEWWLGGPLVSACVWDMDQGRILEEEARPWFEVEFGVIVRQVGFITTDDGRAGCSPDGMIDDCGIEIKCPQPTAHVKNLMSGEVPDNYLPQVHGGMFVTGLDSWKFVSYRRGFPKLVLDVERAEKIQSVIRDAVTAFTQRLEIEKGKLIYLNGGPPQRHRFKPQEAFVSEMPS